MTPDERERLAVRLCQLWPRKFETDELTDWCERLNRYRVSDALAALDEHKNASKFKPQPSEILARLKGKEVTSRNEEREESQADVMRRNNPQWSDCSDREVVLRYWRGLWFRKKAIIDGKLAAVAALEERAKRKGESEKEEGFKEARQMFMDDLNGFRNFVIKGCTISLMTTGLDEEVSERCVLFCFEESLDMARIMLADVRQMNDQGEPVDVFA